MSKERQRKRTPGFIADFIALLSPPEGTVDHWVGGASFPPVITGPGGDFQRPWPPEPDTASRATVARSGPGAPAGGEFQGTR